LINCFSNQHPPRTNRANHLTTATRRKEKTIKMSPIVVVAESSLAGGKRLSSSAHFAVLLLLLLLFSPTSSEEGVGDPSQPQLPINIAGKWVSISLENCHQYKAGQFVFEGVAPNLDVFLTNSTLRKDVQSNCNREESYVGEQIVYVWQDCLECTTTNGDEVHHSISDGSSIFIDWMHDIPVEWKSYIEPPLPEEALDGATATIAMYIVDPVTKERYHPLPEHAGMRRYINSDGNLVLTRDAMKGMPANAHNSSISFSTRMKIIHERIPGSESEIDNPACNGYDVDLCADRVYTDETMSWTVACCENLGGDYYFDWILRYPRPEYYEGERAYGIADCDGPN